MHNRILCLSREMQLQNIKILEQKFCSKWIPKNWPWLSFYYFWFTFFRLKKLICMAVLIHNIHKNWMAAVSMSLCSLSDCLSLITKVISGSSVALHNNSSNFYHQVFWFHLPGIRNSNSTLLSPLQTLGSNLTLLTDDTWSLHLRPVLLSWE